MKTFLHPSFTPWKTHRDVRVLFITWRHFTIIYHARLPEKLDGTHTHCHILSVINSTTLPMHKIPLPGSIRVRYGEAGDERTHMNGWCMSHTHMAWWWRNGAERLCRELRGIWGTLIAESLRPTATGSSSKCVYVYNTCLRMTLKRRSPKITPNC